LGGRKNAKASGVEKRRWMMNTVGDEGDENKPEGSIFPMGATGGGGEEQR